MGTQRSTFRRKLRLALLLLGGILAFVVIEPHTLRFALKHLLIYQAKQNDALLEIGRIDGHLFGTYRLYDLRLTSSQCGVTSNIDIKEAEAFFKWKALLGNQGKGFFHRLALNHLSASISFDASKQEVERRRYPKSWIPSPTHLDLQDGYISATLGKRFVELSGVEVSVDSASPGEITLSKVILGEKGGSTRIFTDLKGSTALQGTRLLLADLKLGPTVTLKALTTDLANLTLGRVKVGFDFAAFTGSIRGELVNAPRLKLPHYEVAGSFENISVRQLAEFLGSEENADGLIQEGKFTFRGSPQELEKATFSTWFEATNFLWAERRWTSLTLGASVVNRRIHIPELYLRQEQNNLKLKGEILLPPSGTPWWQSEFNFDIAAQFENLKELTNLIGADVVSIDGKMTIDGSVRGLNNAFSGQLIVAGREIVFRNTPFDLFNAGIKLEGNELRVINFEMARGRDFIRGKGGVTILGDRRYWGEVNANIASLATYSDLLAKPITPFPLEGGIVLDWAGDGGTSYHSGAFTARLRKIRTPGTEGIPATLPIDAELEGSYAPGNLILTTCRLAHGDTQVEGRLSAVGSTLKLSEIKLHQKKTLWLEGDATLPVNLMAWWLSPGMEAVDTSAPISVSINARGVQLEEVSQLTGRPLPIRGFLSGTIQTEGTLRELQMTGALSLAKGSLPETPYLPALDAVEAQADLSGKVFRFNKLTGKAKGGSFTASGVVDLSDIENPALELTLSGEKIEFTSLSTIPDTPAAWSGRTSFEVTVSGAARSATLSGTLQPEAFTRYPLPNFAAFLGTGESDRLQVDPPRFALPQPYQQWNADLRLVANAKAFKLKDGQSIALDLHYQNDRGILQPTGTLQFQNIPATIAKVNSKIDQATYQWLAPVEPPYFVATATSQYPFSPTGSSHLYRYYAGALPQLASITLGQRELLPIPFTLATETESLRSVTIEEGEPFSFYKETTEEPSAETKEAEGEAPETPAADPPQTAMP